MAVQGKGCKARWSLGSMIRMPNFLGITLTSDQAIDKSSCGLSPVRIFAHADGPSRHMFEDEPKILVARKART